MRAKAVMIRILLQLKHDKRTIALMIVAPMMVMLLLSYVFGGTAYHPRIGIVNAPLSFVTSLENNDAVVTRYDESSAYTAIKAGHADAIINFENGVPKIELEGSDLQKNNAVLALVQSALQKTASRADLDVTYLYGYKNMANFDDYGPILIGFFIFFFVFLIAGVSFLGERNSGTLERLLATPIHRWEIVLGYFLGFGVFTIIQSGIIAWFTINILHIMMMGSFLLVLLITILTAMTALSIGTFISAFADNELQMIQFIPIVIVPQVFFSGLFDLSTMAVWLQSLGRVTPLWYVADALRNIMIRGKGLQDIWLDIIVLILTCIFFAFANVFALKKYRKI